MAASGSRFGRRTTMVSNGGLFPERDLIAWSSWPHQGHRLWASMSDAFWVYFFKVHRCPHPGSHDWTLCPYAHRGERARRRDPRRYLYLAVPCPEYRASHEYHLLCGTGEAPICSRGLTCRYAHGVFELWLHPERFRTRMCDAGIRCQRKICFFAHSPSQRRREDDVVPFVGMAMLPPQIQYPPPPPPPPSPRPRPRVVDAPISSLPRPDMVMQTRSGQRLPLYGNDEGASSLSSSSAAAVATPPPPPTPLDDSGSSSAGSSSSRRAEQDSDSDDDDLQEWGSIIDMLERLVMD